MCWVSSLTRLSPDRWLKERGIYTHIALFCVMPERTKHIHAQRSFHLLAEPHKTLAKRLVGETTGHPFNSLTWENPSLHKIFNPFSMEIFWSYTSKKLFVFLPKIYFLRIAIIIRVKNTNKKGVSFLVSSQKETKGTIWASNDHFA